MKIANQEVWAEYVEKNKDGYGKGIIDYAERWANLMEEKMAEGAKLEDIAEATGHTADTDGITGYMYNAAIITLAGVWEYGDQLRRWHNSENGVSEEQVKGGVVNTAVLTIRK